MNRSLAFAAALLLAGACGTVAAGSPWSVGAELGATYDSNAGNAHSSDDTRVVGRVGAGINSTYTQALGLFTALQWRGALDGEGDVGIGDLSLGRVSTRLRLLHKPGVGFYVPVLAAWTSGDYQASASKLRTGGQWRAGAYLAEPITTQLQSRLGFSWSRRAMDGRAYDGQTRSYELTVDWAVLPQLTVYGEYRIDHGPIVVSAKGDNTVVPKTEHLYLYQYADSVEPDPAFGDYWFAYRLKARTGIATLGFNLPLSRDVSLDAQLRRAHSVADTSSYSGGGGGGPGPGSYGYSGFDYDRWLGGVSLLIRF